jgi:hypothetical protein
MDPMKDAGSPLGERLLEAVQHAGRSLQWLEGPPAKWPRGYPSMVKTGRRKKLGPDLLKSAADALGVNYEWLATGKGAMVGNSPSPSGNVELGKAIEFLRGALPDDFLDGWIGANSDRGWEGVDRKGFVTMIEASYMQNAPAQSGAATLEKARAKKIARKPR